MIVIDPRRAGERRRRSLPSERLSFARSALRPRLLDAGLVDAGEFRRGEADALAGRKWALTEADILDRERVTETMSYMLGYKAGELERRSGGGARELAGRDEED